MNYKKLLENQLNESKILDGVAALKFTWKMAKGVLEKEVMDINNMPEGKKKEKAKEKFNKMVKQSHIFVKEAAVKNPDLKNTWNSIIDIIGLKEFYI